VRGPAYDEQSQHVRARTAEEFKKPRFPHSEPSYNQSTMVTRVRSILPRGTGSRPGLGARAASAGEPPRGRWRPR
jgi:hypothetical protein